MASSEGRAEAANAASCCKGRNRIAVNGGAERRSYTAYRHAFDCSNALLDSNVRDRSLDRDPENGRCVIEDLQVTAAIQGRHGIGRNGDGEVIVA